MAARQYSISAATESEGFSDVGGILALGPASLSEGNCNSDPKKQIPTFVQTLFQQGAIKQAVFSVYFQPTSLVTSQNGVITIGSIDTSRGVGPKYTLVMPMCKRLAVA